MTAPDGGPAVERIAVVRREDVDGGVRKRSDGQGVPAARGDRPGADFELSGDPDDPLPPLG